MWGWGSIQNKGRMVRNLSGFQNTLTGFSAGIFLNLFFHGHAPGKNSLTREQLRKAAAKPARRLDPFWDVKTNEVFLHPVALDILEVDDSVAVFVPQKIFDFSGAPIDLIDLQRVNRLQIDAAGAARLLKRHTDQLLDILEINNCVAVFVVLDGILIQSDLVDGLQVLGNRAVLRLVVGDDLLGSGGLVAQQSIGDQQLCLCGVDAQTICIGDVVVDTVACTGSTGSIELDAGHDAGDIAEVGGACAPLCIVECDAIGTNQIDAALLDQLHEGFVMELGCIAGTVAQLDACAHSRRWPGPRHSLPPRTA